MPNIERILILTSPLQQFSVFVRRVYCWEEPRKTAQYMGIYFILWYLNLLLTGLVSGQLSISNSKLIEVGMLDYLRGHTTSLPQANDSRAARGY